MPFNCFGQNLGMWRSRNHFVYATTTIVRPSAMSSECLLTATMKNRAQVYPFYSNIHLIEATRSTVCCVEPWRLLRYSPLFLNTNVYSECCTWSWIRNAFFYIQNKPKTNQISCLFLLRGKFSFSTIFLCEPYFGLSY